MPKIQFLGKVLPLAIKINTVLPTITATIGEKAMVIDIDISIEDNVVLVNCNMNKYDPIVGTI